MADVKPFRGLRYNPGKVDIRTVVSPPYDEISDGYQEELYHLNPYNVVRLILGREQDRYKEAAECLATWQKDGILKRDVRRAVYVLSQSFKHTNGVTLQRYGFITLCRLEELSSGVILPHERTLSKPKEDRFRLMRATNANLSQVFGLYVDPDKAIDRMLRAAMNASPIQEVMFEKVINRLWAVEDQDLVEAIAAAMKPKSILIADGHHRYETALTYRDMMRLKTPGYSGDEPFNFVMMFLSSMDAEGLVILPTHRIVHGLPSFDAADLQMRLAKNFTVEMARSQEELLTRLKGHSRYAYGVVTSDSLYLITLESDNLLPSLIGAEVPMEVKELDVTFLHSHVIEGLLGISPRAQESKLNLDYVKSIEEASQAVQKKKANVAFILNATPLEQVKSVVRAGHTLPQKSTYFYPKLLSGFVMNLLES